jgi:hypothetical protein
MGTVVARLAIIVPTNTNALEAIKYQRRPKMSDSRPIIGMAIAWPSVVEVMIHIAEDAVLGSVT